MSTADEIRKLDDLRKQGLISSAEFEQQKRLLLDGAIDTQDHAVVGQVPAWANVGLKNKWWFQWLLSVIAAPLGLVLVLFFKSYRRDKTGFGKRVSIGFKAIFVMLVLAVWGGALYNLTNLRRSSDLAATGTMIALPSCESVRGSVRTAVDERYHANALPIPAGEMFDHLHEWTSNAATMMRSDLVSRQHLADADIRLCVNDDQGELLTILVRRGGRLEGVVTNYGIPNDAAQLNDLHPGPSGTSVASSAPAADANSPIAGSIDFGVLGPPATTSAIEARLPADDLQIFRYNEAHPATGTAEHPMNWDAIVEAAEVQRAIFYSVASRAPEIITAQDRARLKADEDYIVSSDCGNYSSPRPYAALTDDYCARLAGQ